MPDAPVRYQSSEEDSARWEGFPFRAGDIVISTRSKSGTTWMQMICALLVFQTPRPTARLAQLSPWLDWLVRPRGEVIAQLEDGVLKDSAAFFRRGSSGAGREVLTSAEYDAYLAHAAALAPPDLLDWLHR